MRTPAPSFPLALFLAVGAAATVSAGTIEKAMPITAEVRFGKSAPYRFLVDTGAQSTVVDPQLAAELALSPQFRVEVVDVLGSRFVTGTLVKGLSVQGLPVPEVEVLIDEPVQASAMTGTAIRGVLGANALASFNYRLEPSAGRLIAGAERPPGEVMPFQLEQGRMVVRGRMGGELLRFVLDSGSSQVMLFRWPAAMRKRRPLRGRVKTLDGAAGDVKALWTAELVFGERVRVGMLPAAVVSPAAGRTVDGLFPAAAFAKLFVDQARREIVVEPRTGQ